MISAFSSVLLNISFVGHKVNNPKGKGEDKDQNGVKLFRYPFFGSPFFGFPAVIAQIHDCCDKQSPEHKNYSVEGVGDRNDQIEDEKKSKNFSHKLFQKFFSFFIRTSLMRLTGSLVSLVSSVLLVSFYVYII